MQVIYATTNPGKFAEAQKLYAAHDIQIHQPKELGGEVDVDETGHTLEENAIIKAEYYRDVLPTGSIVVGDDTGLEIDALGGEPGIKVRRWKGYRMTDEEIIEHALERLKGVPDNKRTARFRTVIAVAANGHPTQTFDGVLQGRILQEPHEYREEGLPFQPLFYATEYEMMIYQIHAMKSKDKLMKNILTHRERAINASLAYLHQLIDR